MKELEALEHSTEIRSRETILTDLRFFISPDDMGIWELVGELEQWASVVAARSVLKVAGNDKKLTKI